MKEIPRSRIKQRRTPSRKKRTFRNHLLILLLFIVVFMWCLYDSNYNIDVKEYSVELNSLPKGFDGYKIVQISDLHGVQFGEDNSEIVLILEEIQPDLIVITGDVVERVEDFPQIYGTAAAFAEIAPVYYVPGNHEYGTRSSSEIFRILKSAGVTVLRNQSVTLTRNGDEIVLVGIDDPNGPADMIPMENVIAKIRSETDDFILMLNHRYERFAEYTELEIPLVLTGHAHGGLIRLPFTDGLVGPGRELFPKYTNGLYQSGDTIMLTSRGIGNTQYSLRLFDRPHIPVITLASIYN